MTNRLVLVRHGESEWNKKNIFTGIRNPDLTDKGVIEACWAGRVMKSEGIRFDIAFTSKLKRAQHTLDIILSEIGGEMPDVIQDAALNERDYGELSGLNKDQARERWGEEQVLAWRRSYDVPPPGGESLKDTAARVQPYYLEHIWPHVAAGKNVIISAHGNSLRALIMFLEKLSEDQILDRELATAAPQLYRLTETGDVAEYRELVRSEGRDSGLG
ncbi:2,3-bisphosphoglycerate-dependent phosphoglycerate mutase [Hyphomicrobium sp.]|uniref:2,3-bisphosphoglycerate-dependent phosphoglycerate mutase n=1 Tax=Hyphomicrobium sp. TaxID=82 RepID=UPI002E35C111|nr:2,3-bisphosphoglycerate-dependent phosphoglycerate mutase [Hyphomicrobium sp.]HEX2840650.1 2,3-bisphosphoglycerate-dependent phosphoglycerate mutase [Hyphomicrobium sp.]